MPYIILILLPFVAATLKKNPIFINISFLMMFIVAGTRYNTGGDLIGYENYFESTLPLSDYLSGSFTSDLTTIKYYFEFLFTLINSICKTLELGMAGVYVVTSATINYIYFLCLKHLKHQLDPAVFLMIFSAMLFPLMEMHYIRQGLSTAFLLFMLLVWTHDKSVLKTSVLFLCAFGTHVMTASTLGPMLFMYKTRRRLMLWILAASLIVYILNIKVFSAILGLINFDEFSQLNELGFSQLISEYTELDIDKATGLSLTSYLSITLAFLNLLFFYRKYEDILAYRVSLYLIFLHAAFSLLSFEFPIFNRIFFSLLIGYPMLAAVLFKNSLRTPLALMSMLFFSIIYFVRIFYADGSNYELFFPYQSVFTHS